MIKEKTMRVGLIAVAALMIVGMAFVPAVAADEPSPDPALSPDNPHYDGSYFFTDEEVGTGISAKYNDITQTIYIAKGTSSDGKLKTKAPLSVAKFGSLDTDVLLISVDGDVNLSDAAAANAFANFTNAEFHYIKQTSITSEPNENLFGSAKKIYKVTPLKANVKVNVDLNGVPAETGTATPVGEAVVVDTEYAYEGQLVKVAVKPLQNYGVYGWEVFEGEDSTGTALADTAYTLEKSKDPEDGGTTYIFTMLGKKVALMPKLRDSASTFVTYVFLNADSYVLEIPADFALKGIGDSKAVAEKFVKLTACDLLDGHKLTVNMKSEGTYKNSDWTNVTTDGKTNFTGSAFVLKSIKDPGALGAYTIGTKAHYLSTIPEEFTLVTTNDAAVLETETLKDETIIEKIAEDKLKTELQFTLKGINHNQLGKYKDKLTFTVVIGDKA